ncbi:hypothetical protein WL77_32355 [Burkholderia ubonensis]|uniref:phosphoribosyltransferase-like protein n=1 Tax=Burkholderia ubonensis TaxID=101571 RepID=UPI00075300C0|nr:hypothetical protein [Burkholderia ubonensis]KWE76654.1 hypothetical protein WL77_32355 [Burkholderia ubonensis]KWE77761.1 hypothetical protein WL79_06650 [Burkholderia ubonensis]
MKATLAKSLVAKLMNWTDEEATNAFQWLELMVDYKFDHYKQYGPGHRFYVHLLRWLSQFDASDRECAWGLLREQLIYVSQDEMTHMVSLTGPIIDREMRAAVAKRLSLPVYRVLEDETAIRKLEEMRHRTLYVGVSDGAHIDVFRRFNEGRISNEQVVPMIEISEKKQINLKEKLQKRLTAMKSDAPATFEWVCLIDDFTASGTTSIRFEKNEWDGKVHRFMGEIGAGDENTKLISDSAHIQVHHYLASAEAKSNVTRLLGLYGAEHPRVCFIPSFTHVFPQNIVISSDSASPIAMLLEGRYDPSIETSHTEEKIALGYKQGGLPLVLDHNTPNNSVATLWARSEPKKDTYVAAKHMWPLFPRRQRHSDVRP